MACQRVLGRDTGSAVQTSAAEVLQNQSYERGIMHTWLQVWGESTAMPETVMAWMGMGMPANEMPGLATAAEMELLATTTGLPQGRLFLQLMRAHHVGGIHMANAAVSMASIATVQGLASRMSASQTYEIAIFDQLLDTTYSE
ncbi:MAG: DUF305 domain-containing protein [Rhodoglobus sp.]